MQRLTIAGVLLAVTMAAPVAAQDEAAAPAKKPAAAKPLYNWIEASYAVNYSGLGDDRRRSDLGYRVGASVKLVDYLHAFASYDSHDFNPNENEYVSAGLGAYWPLGRSTDIGANVSYEQADFDGGVADGFGYGGSIRTMLSRRTELALGIRRTETSDDVDTTGGPVTLDYTFDTVYLYLTAPLARSLDLTFRFENVDQFLEITGGGGTAAFDGEGENYLVGLRFTF